MSGHHAYQMYAHITWHTWMRVGCVDALAAIEVRTAVASAGKKSGVQVLRGAVLADHVHLVVSFRPDTRLSDFRRVLWYVDSQFQLHPDLIPRSPGPTDPGRKPGDHPKVDRRPPDPGRKPAVNDQGVHSGWN